MTGNYSRAGVAPELVVGPSTASPERSRSILVAPDSFKGTFTAERVAAAIGAGVGDAGWSCDLCPVADGGEGTASALLHAGGGRVLSFPTTDPLGRPIYGSVALLGNGAVAVVEAASASGLSLLSDSERDVMQSSTEGTGLLIVAAVELGARHVLVAAGGSATVDYGRGALAAISSSGGLRGASLTVLCDVDTTWEDCARIFGPQKGARPEQVRELQRLAAPEAARLPRNPLGVPMSGAAGGLAGALWAALDAELTAGAAHVLSAVQFDHRLARATATITGEGCVDSQSAMGKIVGEIGRRASATTVPAHAIAGSVGLRRHESIAGIASVTVATTLAEIRLAARRLGLELRGAQGCVLDGAHR
ncbi:glycerate kinase [Conexibacter sp. S30A1]|uniref:glycerate kinase n=1 Tax=Conexibacter sp. S30A1 TaxID=2937800 RepID=UPI00353086C6